jgi:hypothetical protein
MTIKPLYRYEIEGGMVVVSPIKPDCEYEERFRLIADEGKVLVYGDSEPVECVDVISPEGWTEIDAPEEEPEEPKPEHE